MNSPVRLAAFNESGKDSVSLKMLRGTRNVAVKARHGTERHAVTGKCQPKSRKMSRETLPRTTVEPIVAHMKCGAECPLEAYVKCTVM